MLSAESSGACIIVWSDNHSYHRKSYKRFVLLNLCLFVLLWICGQISTQLLNICLTCLLGYLFWVYRSINIQVDINTQRHCKDGHWTVNCFLYNNCVSDSILYTICYILCSLCSTYFLGKHKFKIIVQLFRSLNCSRGAKTPQCLV